LDISWQKEDGRTLPKKEDMSSQRRDYGNPNLKPSSEVILIKKSKNFWDLIIKISKYFKVIQAKIDFLKWYLSVNSSEIYGKFRVFGPKKIKKINFSLYSGFFISQKFAIVSKKS
jgi:hypothetical protein